MHDGPDRRLQYALPLRFATGVVLALVIQVLGAFDGQRMTETFLGHLPVTVGLAARFAFGHPEVVRLPAYPGFAVLFLAVLVHVALRQFVICVEPMTVSPVECSYSLTEGRSMNDADRPRLVVACSLDVDAQPADRQTHRQLAAWLAQIQGLEFRPEPPEHRQPGQPFYWVPDATVVGREQAAEFGIHGPLDLFGGFVERDFQAGKAIVHPLIERPTLTPRGWSEVFATRVQSLVLDGQSVFCHHDAVRCASARLPRGPQRLKPAASRGGQGQQVIADSDQLAEALARYEEEDYREGLVIEDDLDEPQTHSVGQVMINGVLLSYHGVQQHNRNPLGERVYGGSDLLVVRGDFDCLLALDLVESVKLAIQQAVQFDRAAHQLLPGFFASRRNYDIAQGVDAQGRRCSGVLEQSWRIGGASGAELAALEAFVADPTLCVVRASTFEIFEDKPLPQNTRVLYRGPDEHGDFLMKYAMVEPYDFS